MTTSGDVSYFNCVNTNSRLKTLQSRDSIHFLCVLQVPALLLIWENYSTFGCNWSCFAVTQFDFKTYLFCFSLVLFPRVLSLFACLFPLLLFLRKCTSMYVMYVQSLDRLLNRLFVKLFIAVPDEFWKRKINAKTPRLPSVLRRMELGCSLLVTIHSLEK